MLQFQISVLLSSSIEMAYWLLSISPSHRFPQRLSSCELKMIIFLARSVFTPTNGNGSSILRVISVKVVEYEISIKPEGIYTAISLWIEINSQSYPQLAVKLHPESLLIPIFAFTIINTIFRLTKAPLPKPLPSLL